MIVIIFGWGLKVILWIREMFEEIKLKWVEDWFFFKIENGKLIKFII